MRENFLIFFIENKGYVLRFDSTRKGLWSCHHNISRLMHTRAGQYDGIISRDGKYKSVDSAIPFIKLIY